MRRPLAAAAIALAATVGLGAPAMAADTTTTAPDRPIHLTCHEVTVDAGAPAIRCDWDAFDGAAAYRVVATVRRGHKGGFVLRRTDATSFTRKDVKPGHYAFVVQALAEGSKKAIARSNRERVVVGRDGHAAR
jgi:hypothetical protein